MLMIITIILMIQNEGLNIFEYYRKNK